MSDSQNGYVPQFGDVVLDVWGSILSRREGCWIDCPDSDDQQHCSHWWDAPARAAAAAMTPMRGLAMPHRDESPVSWLTAAPAITDTQTSARGLLP